MIRKPRDLRVGDRIPFRDGSVREVTHIRTTEEDRCIYAITLDDDTLILANAKMGLSTTRKEPT